jgi:hypothetical protein
MGGPLNGLLLRRARSPISWGQVALVAAGWIIAIIISVLVFQTLAGTLYQASNDIALTAQFSATLWAVLLGGLGGAVTSWTLSQIPQDAPR